MSRLTGTDAYGLMEAYSSVYAPQELTEEQIWEEVENWVNSLVEEGYDLSEYTWEEMYESYLEEQGRGTRTGSNPNISQNPIAQAIRGDGPSRTLSAADRSRANARPSSSSPTFQNTGGFGRYAPPSAQVKTPAPTRTPAAAARPAGATPKPAAPAPVASSKPAAAPSTTTSATPTPKKPSLSSQAADLRAMRQRSQERQGVKSESFDLFDIVISHLLDEGYADTNEAALAIMANMSEEWRESIVEDFPNVLNFPRQGGSRSGDAGTRGLTKTPTGYINRHSGGEDLPPGTVNKIMGGHLMVKNQNSKSNVKTA
jgi:hypothetical protein